MSGAAKPTILVVDDETDIREIVRMALVFEGWEVREARDGREALALLRESTPAALVLDLMIPGLSGLELARTLIAEGHEDLPVLLISGVNPGAAVVNDFRSLPLRRRDFLHKPFDADELVARVRDLVPREQQPVRAEAAAAATVNVAIPAAARPEHTKGFRILVIDDEPDICLVMKTHLGLFHDVRTASNGMEGLQVFDDFEPDFVLTDINMPRMNGLATAEAIRRHPRLGGVPIFFFTGESDSNLPRKSFDVGGNLFLRKPIDVDQLLKFIDHFIEEEGMVPRVRRESAPPVKAPAPQPVAAPDLPVRIVLVTAAAETMQPVRHALLIDNRPNPRLGATELLVTEDPWVAIGNLGRWQPDVLLYDARHPRLDAVAFGQMAMLQKVERRPDLAFVGVEFAPIEADYARRNFGREPFDLRRAGESLEERMLEIVTAARRRLRPPRRMTLRAVEEEEIERQGSARKAEQRLERERESFRQRYEGFQSFIDRNCR